MENAIAWGLKKRWIKAGNEEARLGTKNEHIETVREQAIHRLTT
jgi:hypothetical protein